MSAETSSPSTTIYSPDNGRVLIYRKNRSHMVTPFLRQLMTQYEKIVPVDEKYFADGEVNFTIPGLHSLTGKHVTFYANFDTKRIEDLYCLHAIGNMQPSFLEIVVPFFPTATMEREMHEGSLVTACVDSFLLSAINPRCPMRIVTLDLHTMAQQFYFPNGVCATLWSCMPYVGKNVCKHDDIIVFPDEGAWKRFKGQFPCHETVRCSKVRSASDADGRSVELHADAVEKVRGRRVFIVDDLVRSGNTILECAKAARAAGATCVNAFVSHAVFPRHEFENFFESTLLDKFWITDSCINTCTKIAARQANVSTRELFQILPLHNILSHISAE